MDHGWGSYFVFLVAGALSLTLPLVLGLLSRALQRGAPSKASLSPAPQILQDPRTKLNARFFHALNAGVVLLLMALVLIPCIGVFRGMVASGDRVAIHRGLFSLLLTIALTAAGLLYAGKKGDLDWLRSFRRDRS